MPENTTPRITPLLPPAWDDAALDALGAFPAGLTFVLSRWNDGGDDARGMYTLGFLAHYPALAKAFLTLNKHVAADSTLSARERELLVLRISWLRQAEYEWMQHVILGRRAGLTDDELARLQAGPDASGWSEIDADLVRVADELHADASISAGTWTRLSGRYSTQQIMDMIFLVGCYEVLAMAIKSFQIPLEPGVATLSPEDRARMYAPAMSEIQGPALQDEQGIGALTLPGFIAEISETFADNTALRWRDLAGVERSWTYAGMLAESQAVARALLAVGAGRGTRVGLLVSNRPEWLFSMFGTAMAGGVTVALNTFSTLQELEYQLRLSDVEILIMEAGVASRDFVTDIRTLCPTLATATPGKLLDENLPFLRRVVCLDKASIGSGLQDWEDFLAEGAVIPQSMVDAAAACSSPVDAGLVFFSSGSTAQPKAIQQTHRAAALQLWRFGHWYGVDSAVKTWSANGFFWSGNFAMALGSTLTVGGCLVLQRYFDPDQALALLQTERISLAIAWPHQEARLKECPGWEAADLSALVYVDAHLILATHPTINTTWRQPSGYGMTETFTFVSGFRGSENTDNSYGPVLPGNTVRIVDPATGATLPMGETGEIIAKGPTLTPGYLKTPPEALVDGEGFIHTADAGYLTPEGHLFWKGRLGDIIKTGGANVSPTEVDAVLVEHPAIQSVFSVGVPHETLGEIVVSCVILREGQHADDAALRAFARQSLASYKVPRKVLFFTEEELPMTGSNKIQRAQLRKIATELLQQD